MEASMLNVSSPQSSVTHLIINVAVNYECEVSGATWSSSGRCHSTRSSTWSSSGRCHSTHSYLELVVDASLL